MATESPSAAKPIANDAGQPTQGSLQMGQQDFEGEVQTHDQVPSADVLRKIEDYPVLDQHGKSHPFKSLYSGQGVAQRVLIVFNCQEYLRTLSASITPEALAPLEKTTSLVLIGCGDPALIESYAKESNFNFPAFTDPTRQLYHDLEMICSLDAGTQPAYIAKSTARVTMESIVRAVKPYDLNWMAKALDRYVNYNILAMSAFKPVKRGWHAIHIGPLVAATTYKCCTEGYDLQGYSHCTRQEALGTNIDEQITITTIPAGVCTIPTDSPTTSIPTETFRLSKRDNSGNDDSLGTNGKAGIAIGAIVCVVSVAISAFWIYRSRSSATRNSRPQEQVPEAISLEPPPAYPGPPTTAGASRDMSHAPPKQ
ncbi:hypothetical protein FE257_008594 [Aspergillus nanangensis]|uniref:Uncharacterized protein n=1 Tax=Aspergillus nanangensis TaxID=2582783 RepID=A0AAD4CLF1_ASPNN|nr:hypothetical protein FE257_008594 [Aspergillus nanangensis]